MNSIRITNLAKSFGGLKAVDELSLTVQAGEIFACIGPNGSGKTTTVKMLAGLYLPTAGAITISGIDLAAAPSKAKAAIGYIPDEPFIYEKMSGREFLQFVGALYALPAATRTRNLARLLPLFPGLAEVIDGFVESYSRGNKQKLAIVAALLHEPTALLIDEPVVGLDPQSIATVKKLLKDFAASGGAVFLVTHTLAIAEDVATRIGILQRGRLVAEGTLQELRAKAGKPNAGLEEVYLTLTSK